MRLTRRQACASFLKMSSGLLLASACPGLGCGPTQRPPEPDLLLSMAFGSCNKQDALTSHWPIINSMNAQGWLWMGDAIYADEALPKVRAKEYLKVLSDVGYQDMIRRSFLLGTWDDHDYATNDAGIEILDKAESQKTFLDFIGEPLDSPIRTQQGIYQSRLIGKEGQQIQYILLDMRYFKEQGGVTADPIGKAQWAWLEAELQRPGPALKILVSSIQALTDFDGKESWACYPEAQTRLMSLLAKSPVQVLILSGDRHLTEISCREVAPGKLVHDITSSGLTHTTEMRNSNVHRVREQINETNFGVLGFEWDTSGKTQLKSLLSTIYSPQSGAQLRTFNVPLTWG